VVAQPAPISKPVVVPDKRIFGVVPNYRTVELSAKYEPISTRHKFYIATRDSFDYPVFFVAGFFAAVGQLENSNPDFGQGLKGYGKRYITSLGDQVIGNYLTEAVLPSALHQDPRYFRLGTGSFRVRLRYALTRVLITRTDSGRATFNWSEVAGNSGAVAISNLYYPQAREVGANVEKLGMQFGLDALSNVLKEFWPDIKRRRSHRN
jgi:hypothetical protein